MEDRRIEEFRLPLEKAAIHYLELVTQRTWRSNICHECIIEDYSNLKEKVHYSMTRDVQGTERTLKLYKTKKMHCFQLHCELKDVQFQQNHNGELREDKMVFYIMYEKGKPVWSGELNETDYGYSIEVSNELVFHDGNKFLRENNTLVIQFNYRHYTYTRAPVARSGRATSDDEEALSNDMLTLYEKQGKDTEFSIISKEGTYFKIHKVICDARSDYLRQFWIQFPKYLEKTVPFERRIIDMGLRYMYGGKLNDVSLDDLIDLLGFATKCELLPLRQTLTVALREKLHKDNARRIHEAAKIHGLSDLATYAEGFMSKTVPEDTEEMLKNKTVLKKKLRQTSRRR